MRLVVFISMSFLAHLIQAQHYRFHLYRVEQGLPSDVIKAVTEDSLGFLWIASDDGLVKYDGIKFTTYKNALRSQYAKGFLHTSKGKFLAFSDLDVIEIDNQVDTVVFKTLLKGERFPSDSTLWYPKSIYEDRSGGVWLGEPRSVVRYDGKAIRRYHFSEANRSPVFVRSFSFFEDDNGILFTVSYQGNVFRYDPVHDEFVQQKNFQLPEEVSQVLYYEGRLLVAARFGLFSSKVEEGVLQPAENLFPIRSVSNLTLMHDSSVLVSTYLEDLYRVSFNNGFEFENLYYNFNGINSCYVSRENDIWVATDKGIVRVQKNLFQLADVNSQAQFIEGIARDPRTGAMYYANKESVVQLTKNNEGEWNRKVLVEGKTNYFQSLQFGEKGLWASTGWNVLLLQDGRIARTWDFSADGNFVHDMLVDSKDNLWISQAGNSNIRRIDPQLNLAAYPILGISQNEINNIKEGRQGVYAVANGVNTYIFYKAHSDSAFRNVSVPMPFSVKGDFNVIHCAVQGDVVWLASSEGLLRYEDAKISRVRLGENFEQYPVSCVEVLDNDQILFSNSYGLFRYNARTGDYWLYDENSGLPSNTITDHGIFVVDNGELWLGTSYGIAVATGRIDEAKLTRTPFCVEARINGVTTRYSSGIHAAYGAYITAQFSSISFPENKIIYQWRIDNAEWQEMEDGQLSLSTLKEGSHTVSVRAKKNTGLSWSSPTQLTINVALPYWKTAEFIFLVVLLVILIAWASYSISSALLSQRKRYLQEQIDARTHELKLANEELTLRNTELDRFVYSASHDLSAPLKSILGLIRVAKMEKPGDVHQQYLDMMERSVFKLEEFIQEVVTYSRNTRMPVKFETFNFKDFVQGLLQDHQYSPNFQYIDFRIEDHAGGEMISDITRMKIILNNLLSNAIKFHCVDNGRKPYVAIVLEKNTSYYKLTVKDNGRGIGQEHIKRIFEMFYRATDETQGSGLGLYILKEAVLKLGGTVEAASELEQGTQFTILLPLTHN
jgi:signal transduction histidine kinase